ncbi:MAG: GNAT family N-acetyltransferase [Brevinematales bacterium]|nr:GNAT family N-acetyltransferase [Brevinematales bacterium]
MKIRKAGLESLAVLTRMNKELREDEHIDNYMTDVELAERMRGFLCDNSGYEAYLFIEDRDTVGYALVFLNEEPIYIRQFYVCRNARRRGYGTEGIRLLKKALNTESFDLEVLVWNTAAVEFYRSVGFKDRLIRMRME